MSDSDEDDNEPLARRVSFTEDSESNDDIVRNTTKYFYFPITRVLFIHLAYDCTPKEPAVEGHNRGLVRGRHDDSIDSPMVLEFQKFCLILN